MFCFSVFCSESGCKLTEETDTLHTFQAHYPPFFSPLFNCSSLGQLGIDFRPLSIDSILTCLRAIKLSSRIYSRWVERKAKKLSTLAHGMGQRVKKRSEVGT